MKAPRVLIAIGVLFGVLSYIDLKIQGGTYWTDQSWFGKSCALIIPAILLYWIVMNVITKIKQRKK